MNAMLVAVIVIAVIGIIPVIIRKKFLKIYLTLLQKNDIKAIEDLIATQLAKICIPLFNREYLLLNAYLKVNDNKQIDTQVNNIMDHVPMNSKQKSALAKSVFYIYADTPYLEFLLSVIYKNMGNESKSKEYKNRALEDCKGTVYESLIKSQN